MFRDVDTGRVDKRRAGAGRVGNPAWLGITLAAALACAGPAATAQPSLEYAIKAAYLYKLAAFVGWPPSSFEGPASPLRICVIGDDPFKGALEQAVSGISVDGRPVQVARYEAAQPSPACQIAYVAGSASQSRGDALKVLKGSPVLTVTDQKRGAADPAPEDGIVSFVLKDNRVRFDIDERAALDDHLALSGKLLSLALEVRR